MAKSYSRIAILFCLLAGCGAKVELEETPIVVSVPGGFVINTRVYTQNPSLHFHLPFGADGTGSLFSRLSIQQVDTEFHPQTVGAYVSARRRTSGGEFLLEPAKAEAGGQSAIEMAVAGKAVADLLTATGMEGELFELVTHEIVFAYGANYYVCELVSYPDEYETYVDAVRSLCRSVRFARTP